MAAQDFSSIEKLLGLEEGSTNAGLPTSLANKIEEKTKELTDAMDKVTTIKNLPPSELLKTGMSLEELEDDRRQIVTEAKFIYDISKKLLQKMWDDIKDKIVVPDRMYDAASKLVASVTASNKSLRDINTQYRQEEEMRQMAEISSKEETTDGDGKKKRLAPSDITLLINENRRRRHLEDTKIVAQDADLVDSPKKEPLQPDSEV